MRKALVFGAMLSVVSCANPAKDKPAAVVTTPHPAPVAAQEPARDTVFVLTPERSRIEWTGSKVTGSHDGGFRAFSGDVRSPDGTLDKARISVEIDVDSLFSDQDPLTAHLKSPDFFDVATYPKASFVGAVTSRDPSTGMYVVQGNLTLRGVTRGITFPARMALQDGAIRGTVEFSINRKDFGIVYPGKPDDLIRDQVVIRLTVDAPASGTRSP